MLEALASRRYLNYSEHTWQIDALKYAAVISYTIKNASEPYYFVAGNCAHFALGAAEIAGINVPRSRLRTTLIEDPDKVKKWLSELNGEK